MSFSTDFLDLHKDEAKALLYLATIMSEGSPQVTPVWFRIDDEYVLINTNARRTKERNMKARPQVALMIQDPKNQDRYLGTCGAVIGYIREGADEHINRLWLKYYDKPRTCQEGLRRTIYRIKPLHFDLHCD